MHGFIIVTLFMSIFSKDINIGNIKIDHIDMTYEDSDNVGLVDNLLRIIGLQKMNNNDIFTNPINPIPSVSTQNGKIKHVCRDAFEDHKFEDHNHIYADIYDFMIKYPCDTKISKKFVNDVRNYIGKTKKDLLIKYINTKTLCEFYSHTHKCHIYDNTNFDINIRNYNEGQFCFTCKIDTSKSGECYLMTAHPKIKHSSFDIFGENWEEYMNHYNKYSNDFVLNYLSNYVHNSNNIFKGAVYVNVTM